MCLASKRWRYYLSSYRRNLSLESLRFGMHVLLVFALFATFLRRVYTVPILEHLHLSFVFKKSWVSSHQNIISNSPTSKHIYKFSSLLSQIIHQITMSCIFLKHLPLDKRMVRQLLAGAQQFVKSSGGILFGSPRNMWRDLVEVMARSDIYSSNHNSWWPFTIRLDVGTQSQHSCIRTQPGLWTAKHTNGDQQSNDLLKMTSEMKCDE